MENGFKLFVENPAKLFDYKVIIKNKKVLRLSIKSTGIKVFKN